MKKDWLMPKQQVNRLRIARAVLCRVRGYYDDCVLNNWADDFAKAEKRLATAERIVGDIESLKKTTRRDWDTLMELDK